MNKLKLITILLLSAVLLQNCKKDDATATTTTTEKLQAYIDITTWVPDTISTTITYNAALKTKTLFCTGTVDQKRIAMSITLSNADSSDGFPLGTYSVDATNRVVLQYFTQQKDSNGNYVFVLQGTVTPGAGSVVITAIDPVKNVLTGTFNYISRYPIYDSSGNLVSYFIANISAGEFNSLPYSFITN